MSTTKPSAKPEPKPLTTAVLPGTHTFPAVLKHENGWGVFQLTLADGVLTESKRVHGPDLKRVCMARALKMLESN